MRRNNIKWLAGLFVAIICFNGMNFASADSQGWNVANDDILIFNILSLQDGTTIESGTFNITIIDISETGALNYSLNAAFTIDEGDYATNLTATNMMEVGEILTVLSNINLLYSIKQTNLMIQNDEADTLELENYYYDLYIGNLDVRYSFKKLKYGYEFKFENSADGINNYTKIQRDSKGILIHYEIASLNSDGLETGFKIKFNSFGGQEGSSIAGFNVGLLLFLSVVSLIGIIYKRKQ